MQVGCGRREDLLTVENGFLKNGGDQNSGQNSVLWIVVVCGVEISQNLSWSSSLVPEGYQDSEGSGRRQPWIQVCDGAGKYQHIQFSLGTPEILLKWQDYNYGERVREARVFDVAEAEKINLVSCSPLFQGKIATLPFQSKVLDYLQNPTAKHLQLIRSFPSPSLLTTLVGMTSPQHVAQNLQLMGYPRLSEAEWRQILPIPE